MAGTNVNPKAPPWYGGGLSAVLRPGANQGDVIYVDGTGPDTNDGRTPTTPVASFLAALALCTNQRNDTIVVLDYYNHANDAWPIVVDKEMVSIIGVPGAGAMWPQVHPDEDEAAFSITALGVEICNLAVHGGAAHGAIEIAASVWGTEIHHCWFGETDTAQDGIRGVAPFDAVYLKIWGCRFGVGLTRDGVRLDHNATRGMIGVPGLEPNTFRAVAGQGINITNQFAQGGIYDNRFSVADAAHGEAILLAATSAGVNVDGNRAWQGQAAMGFVPFRDLGTNCWGLNHSGLAPTYPRLI